MVLLVHVYGLTHGIYSLNKHTTIHLLHVQTSNLCTTLFYPTCPTYRPLLLLLCSPFTLFLSFTARGTCKIAQTMLIHDSHRQDTMMTNNYECKQRDWWKWRCRNNNKSNLFQILNFLLLYSYMEKIIKKKVIGLLC